MFGGAKKQKTKRSVRGDTGSNSYSVKSARDLKYQKQEMEFEKKAYAVI